MIPIKFEGKKFKTGNVSAAVIIPKSIADLLEFDEKYIFTISKKEGENDEDSKLLCVETEGQHNNR